MESYFNEGGFRKVECDREYLRPDRCVLDFEKSKMYKSVVGRMCTGTCLCMMHAFFSKIMSSLPYHTKMHKQKLYYLKGLKGS